MDKEIEMILKDWIIEQSTNEWVPPMVIIKKKDSTIQLCVDYRRLNAETYLDAYPISRIDDILDEVGQTRFISTLDLAKGYWQVPVAKEDQHKKAFTTLDRLYQFRVIPLAFVKHQLRFSE